MELARGKSWIRSPCFPRGPRSVDALSHPPDLTRARPADPADRPADFSRCRPIDVGRPHDRELKVVAVETLEVELYLVGTLQHFLAPERVEWIVEPFGRLPVGVATMAEGHEPLCVVVGNTAVPSLPRPERQRCRPKRAMVHRRERLLSPGPEKKVVLAIAGSQCLPRRCRDECDELEAARRVSGINSSGWEAWLDHGWHDDATRRGGRLE